MCKVRATSQRSAGPGWAELTRRRRTRCRGGAGESGAITHHRAQGLLKDWCLDFVGARHQPGSRGGGWGQPGARGGTVEPHCKGSMPPAVRLTVPSGKFLLSLLHLKRSLLHHLCPSPHSHTALLCPASSAPCTAPWRPHPGTTQLHWSHLVDTTCYWTPGGHDLLPCCFRVAALPASPSSFSPTFSSSWSSMYTWRAENFRQRSDKISFAFLPKPGGDGK